jgi:DNA (cytosine-5)-methyltransferase 1
MASSTSRKPISVDLFCGAGGLSEGLRQAGFETVFAADFDPNCVMTYRANHPKTTTAEIDIAKLDAKQILDACNGQELDLLAGGPSCQGYSTHGKRNADDPRNFLFKHFIRLAGELRPKWLLMENVPGLLTFQKGYFKNLIIAQLEALGYRADARVLCAADYGVPQLRRRIFFLATRTDSAIVFPSPTHAPLDEAAALTPYVTIAEAIGDLPLLKGDLTREEHDYICDPSCEYQRYARQFSPRLTMHQANGMSAQAKKVAKFIREGQGLRSVPVRHLPARFKKMRTISNGQLRKDCTTLYYRLDRKRPGYTITCYFRNVASGPFMHPLEDRSLSYREAARIMSFQDRYRFEGTGFARQIGNAVPPILARAFGKQILAMLKQEATQPRRRRKVVM